MAKKGGTLKRFFLTITFLALIGILFIIFGGGTWLGSAGKWISGVGKDAEVVRHKMEEKASETGKAVEKVIETVKPDEKPGEKK